MKKKLTVMLAILLALGLTAISCSCQSEAPEIGKKAPAFELATLDGQTVALSELKGRPVLLNFWASYCGPCVHEMPYLQQVYEERQGEELALLAVNIGESPSQAAEFMQSYGFSFTVLLDSQATVAQKYNIIGIPTTFFIDKGGIIQKIKIGYFQSQAEIENILSEID
jgi:peroxiredoxin